MARGAHAKAISLVGAHLLIHVNAAKVVVIVDDDPSVLKVVDRLLTANGLDTEVFPSGEALRIPPNTAASYWIFSWVAYPASSCGVESVRDTTPYRYLHALGLKGQERRSWQMMRTPRPSCGLPCASGFANSADCGGLSSSVWGEPHGNTAPHVADWGICVTVCEESLIRPTSVEICIVRPTARPRSYSAFRLEGRYGGAHESDHARASAGAFAAALTLGALPMVATADEGGVSFWIPGFFGSLAATPQQPGFTWASIYYHTSVSAGADIAFARQVSRGGNHRELHWQPDRQPRCGCGYRLRHSDLRVRHPGSGWAGSCRPAGAVWPQHRLSGRDADRSARPHRLHGVGQPHRIRSPASAI